MAPPALGGLRASMPRGRRAAASDVRAPSRRLLPPLGWAAAAAAWRGADATPHRRWLPPPRLRPPLQHAPAPRPRRPLPSPSAASPPSKRATRRWRRRSPRRPRFLRLNRDRVLHRRYRRYCRGVWCSACRPSLPRPRRASAPRAPSRVQWGESALPCRELRRSRSRRARARRAGARLVGGTARRAAGGGSGSKSTPQG